jgi:hypothetical protein
MTPEIATRTPYFSPLFNDLVLQALMRNLQKNINMSAASRILFGEVPLLKDSAAKVKDMIAINPDLLGKFLALVKSSISSSINVASAPLQNMAPITFPAENDLYSSYLKTTLASSGVNTSLIFTSDVRPNILETTLSLNTDEQLMSSVYPQFNQFLNYQINKLTKTFKFEFEFEGTQFSNNREKRLETQMKLLDKGIALPQKIAAAIGMKPNTFLRHMEEAKANRWIDGLTPILPPNQIPLGENGRPRKDISELSDEGAQTRDDGGNIGKVEGAGKI